MNLIRYSFRLVIFLLLSQCQIVFADTNYVSEPENLGLLKRQINNYVKSGSYEHDIETVITKATQYLKTQLAKNANSDKKLKLAIVLDIDETAVSNLELYKKVDYSQHLEYFLPEILDIPPSAITPVLNLFNFAKANAVSVFFISGRSEKLLNKTTEQLKNVGYHNWDGIYLMPSDFEAQDTYSKIAAFKMHMRALIASQGYEIVLNIGDQPSDLIGDAANYTAKLPDPFYYSSAFPRKPTPAS